MENVVMVVFLVMTSVTGVAGITVETCCSIPYQKLKGIINDLTSRLQALEDKPAAASGFHAAFGQLDPHRSITTSKENPVYFNRTLVNFGKDYNLTTGTYIAPCSGLYIFNLRFAASLEHDDFTVLEISSGDQAHCLAKASRTGNYEEGSCWAVVHLDQGQEVSVRLHDGNSLIAESPFNSFSGVLVQCDR